MAQDKKTHTVPNRDNWIIGKDKQLLKDKDMLINFHFNFALTKTLTMFKYGGLPETIPQREFELILQTNDFLYFKKVKDEYYVFFGGLGGKPNEYYLPTQFIVANPYLQYFEVLEVDKDGVLVWNDYVHRNVLYFLIRRYAELMTECDITLRFGLINDRLVSILSAIDDTSKISAEKLLQDVEDGVKLGVILGDSWIDENGNVKVYDYRKANTQDIKDVMELQQYLKASFWNDIGIQANYNMKRESLNGNEVGMNEECLKPYVDDLLQCRKDGIEKINKMYGLNITVELNSSWVRREEIPEDETKENEPEQPNEEPKEEEPKEEPKEGEGEE